MLDGTDATDGDDDIVCDTDDGDGDEGGDGILSAGASLQHINGCHCTKLPHAGFS